MLDLMFSSTWKKEWEYIIWHFQTSRMEKGDVSCGVGKGEMTPWKATNNAYPFSKNLNQWQRITGPSASPGGIPVF